MYYYLKLAENVLQIETPDHFEIADDIRQFFIDSSEDQPVIAQYKVHIDRTLRLIPQKILHQSPSRFIFENDSCEYRVHFLPGTMIPFAYYQETPSGIKEIHIVEDSFPKHIFSIVFLELLALEKVLLSQNSLVLHSSYIICGGRSVLFTAPSGTGKSTQADLWRKHMQAEIINGDRSIMHISERGVTTHGIPFCGTSGINLSKSAPLAGIILIEQAPENSICECPKALAIRKLYSECSINYWNHDSVDTTLSLIEKMVETTPVYILKCTISEEAVNLVHDKLYK